MRDTSGSMHLKPGSDEELLGKDLREVVIEVTAHTAQVHISFNGALNSATVPTTILILLHRTRYWGGRAKALGSILMFFDFE